MKFQGVSLIRCFQAWRALTRTFMRSRELIRVRRGKNHPGKPALASLPRLKANGGSGARTIVRPVPTVSAHRNKGILETNGFTL